MWCGKYTDKVAVTPEFFTVGFEALEPGLAFMLAFANVVAVDTAVGPVIIDASSFHLADLLLVWPARLSVRSRCMLLIGRFSHPDALVRNAGSRRWPRSCPSPFTRAF